MHRLPSLRLSSLVSRSLAPSCGREKHAKKAAKQFSRCRKAAKQFSSCKKAAKQLFHHQRLYFSVVLSSYHLLPPGKYSHHAWCDNFLLSFILWYSRSGTTVSRNSYTLVEFCACESYSTLTVFPFLSLISR